jgi:putative methyltransferase (TIGR04325 family)
LPNPLDILAGAVAAAPDFILIDRTPTLARARNVLALQSVPKLLGGASYPVWLFNVRSLLEPIEAKYRKVCEFATVDSDMDYRFMPVKFRGFLFERNVE